MDTLTLFSKNLNQRSLTPRWPLTPCLLRSRVTLLKDHCVQVPWQYINVCGYSDQFCKLPHTYIHYHIHTHTTYRISDHIVSYWTQFRRDNKMMIFDHLQHTKQWELYLAVWNLHSSSQKRWWGFKTPAPTFKPALLQAWRSTQMHWLFRGRGKRSHQLVSQTHSLKFQYIVESKEDYAY